MVVFSILLMANKMSKCQNSMHYSCCNKNTYLQKKEITFYWFRHELKERQSVSLSFLDLSRLSQNSQYSSRDRRGLKYLFLYKKKLQKDGQAPRVRPTDGSDES